MNMSEVEMFPRLGNFHDADPVGPVRSGIRTALFPSKTTYHWLYMADHKEVMEKIKDDITSKRSEMEPIYIHGYVLQARARFYWWLIAFVIVLVIVGIYIGARYSTAGITDLGWFGIVTLGFIGVGTVYSAVRTFRNVEKYKTFIRQTAPERDGKRAWEKLVDNYRADASAARWAALNARAAASMSRADELLAAQAELMVRKAADAKTRAAMAAKAGADVYERSEAKARDMLNILENVTPEELPNVEALREELRSILAEITRLQQTQPSDGMRTIDELVERSR